MVLSNVEQHSYILKLGEQVWVGPIILTFLLWTANFFIRQSYRVNHLYISHVEPFKLICSISPIGRKRRASLVPQKVKNLPVILETWVRFLSWDDPLEEGMVTHSSILAWRIPWTEEPSRLQSMGSQEKRNIKLVSWTLTEQMWDVFKKYTSCTLTPIVLCLLDYSHAEWCEVWFWVAFPWGVVMLILFSSTCWPF